MVRRFAHRLRYPTSWVPLSNSCNLGTIFSFLSIPVFQMLRGYYMKLLTTGSILKILLLLLLLRLHFGRNSGPQQSVRFFVPSIAPFRQRAGIVKKLYSVGCVIVSVGRVHATSGASFLADLVLLRPRPPSLSRPRLFLANGRGLAPTRGHVLFQADGGSRRVLPQFLCCVFRSFAFFLPLREHVVRQYSIIFV